MNNFDHGSVKKSWSVSPQQNYLVNRHYLQELVCYEEKNTKKIQCEKWNESRTWKALDVHYLQYITCDNKNDDIHV